MTHTEADAPAVTQLFDAPQGGAKAWGVGRPFAFQRGGRLRRGDRRCRGVV